MKNNNNSVDVFVIAQILSTDTVVITGAAVGQLKNGENLIIVYTGNIVPNTQVPLVLEKARVKVTNTTSQYAIAVTPTEVKTVRNQTFNYVFPELLKEETISIRQTLDVNETDIVGNPAVMTVLPGDKVIRMTDYEAYVSSLCE
jgi:hypothetical protein